MIAPVFIRGVSILARMEPVRSQVGARIAKIEFRLASHTSQLSKAEPDAMSLLVRNSIRESNSNNPKIY